ncbi:MAG: FliO/MopB family protein [bacterium]|nr:FliO/MopB family protein [bacterium]
MTASYYVQVIITLSLFAGLLLILLKYSKKLTNQRFSSEIKIIDRKAVDAGATLLIVEIRGQQYIMSAGNKNINLLHKF